MNSTRHAAQIRFVHDDDFDAWRSLWDDYNAFYGRQGKTALPENITKITRRRFLDPDEPIFALVVESDMGLLGLAHYLCHFSTVQIPFTCYLRDLFILESERGPGIGKALIQRVYLECAGLSR
jgi:GNAT superfamily N-acetyltransferase